MRILVIGASGLIGGGVADRLSSDHEVLRASRKGEISVDVNDPESIAAMFAKVGTVDHVVTCFGHVTFKARAGISRNEWLAGLTDKVLGQVEVVNQGVDHVSDGGSFTLTSGILARDPIHSGTLAAAANGALEGFTVAAAIDMPRGQRINCISPTVLEEATGFHPFFPGFARVSLAEVTDAYVKSILGWGTGQIYKLG